MKPINTRDSQNKQQHVIEVRGLSKIYGKGEVAVRALNKVSLQVKKGEFLAIMGPSGSGKSTLMNILGCLDTPTEGDYFLDGINVSRMSEKKLARIRNRKIGFVFQTFNLLPRFSALKNVELPLIYRGLNRKSRMERARKALEEVGLGHRMEHKPSELSGGQQQRVAIARALVNEPQIILADEPTGNLDSRSEEGILEIMNRLNRQGITIVMVTHDRKVAGHAHRIINFLDGEIVGEEVVNGFPAGGEKGEAS